MKAIDYVRIALSIETLAYHDKNYLDGTLAKSNCKISEEVQRLLREAEAAQREEGQLSQSAPSAAQEPTTR